MKGITSHHGTANAGAGRSGRSRRSRSAVKFPRRSMGWREGRHATANANSNAATAVLLGSRSGPAAARQRRGPSDPRRRRGRNEAVRPAAAVGRRVTAAAGSSAPPCDRRHPAQTLRNAVDDGQSISNKTSIHQHRCSKIYRKQRKNTIVLRSRSAFR